MEPTVAVFDANVLFGNFLRDFLVRLSIHGRARRALHAKWTGRIHQEWVRAVRRHQPTIPRSRLLRICRLMDQHVRGCRVYGYRRWERRLILPDPDDRHVLAAGLACVADIIVTLNLTDFPKETLAPFGIVADTPDAFATRLFATQPDLLIAAAREHRASLTRPAMTPVEYLEAMRRNGLASLAAVLPADRI